jgi:tetratricopeptide (TPR) repeat protein
MLFVCTAIALAACDRNALLHAQQQARAAALFAAGDYTAAVQAAQQTQRSIEADHGSDHQSLVASLATEGMSRVKLGQYEAAEPVLLRALTIAEKQTNHNHAAVAHRHTDLVTLYSNWDRFDKAHEHFDLALRAAESITPRDPELLAALHNNIAAAFMRERRVVDAALSFKLALDLLKEAGHTDTSNYATTLMGLAIAQTMFKDYENADAAYTEALSILERTRGRAHPDTAICLQHYALMKHLKGDLAGAEAAYQRGLNILADALGRDHAAVTIAAGNLVSLYREMNRPADADAVEARFPAARKR